MKRRASGKDDEGPLRESGRASGEGSVADLPAYIDELDRRLLDQPENCMLTSMLDGYLVGVILCPDLLSPSIWIPGIWAEGEGDEAPSGDEDELKRLIELIMTHYTATIASLEQPHRYRPIFEVDTRSGETIWEAWIVGFEAAMKLAPDAWYRMVNGDAECEAAASMIAAIAMIADGTSELPEEAQQELTLTAPEIIQRCVEAFYVERLKNLPDRTARPSKVGRNEPCPCGSGKKYKKCCGLN